MACLGLYGVSVKGPLLNFKSKTSLSFSYAFIKLLSFNCVVVVEHHLVKFISAYVKTRVVGVIKTCSFVHAMRFFNFFAG